jgi:hypothetical protein
MAKSVQGNPWLSIWTEPRKTIRSIVDTDPKFGYLLLSAFYGLPFAFNLVQSLDFSSAVPLWAILIGSLVVCVFLGMIGITVSAWLLHICGKLIGGKGTFPTVRAAVAWSNVPNAVTILMWAVLLGIFGAQVFSKNFAEMQFVGYQAGVLFLVMLIESIASVWGFIILLSALREVQGFSIWKAILNIVIPFVAVFAIIWLASKLFWGTGTIS